jgi:hypothetical protein
MPAEPPASHSTTAAATVEAPAAAARKSKEETAAAHTGELQFPHWAAGHRIFIDGHVAGDGKQVLRVACGPHAVKIGSAGKVQQVDVPCGSTLAMTH